MKKFLILPLAMVTVVGICTGNQFGDEPQGNVAYASNALMSVGQLDNNPSAVSKGNTENFKANFAYEMAQITAKVVSASNTNVENFKAEFSYAMAQVTAKVMPFIPSGRRNNFAYEMAQITTKVVTDQNLDIEKAKAEFTYEIAYLTTKIITADVTATGTSADKNVTGKGTMLLRNNADIELPATGKVNKTDTAPKAIDNQAYIAPETYAGLIDELMHVGDHVNHVDRKVNIDGELRLHYALNSGSQRLNKDSSGMRLYLGLDTDINKDWRAYARLEGKKNLVNYDNEFELSRLYAEGKLGTSMVTAGSFGYLMAEGNIYDSGFKGLKVDLGESGKYTLSYGETDYTRDTYVATARYHDFDYDLEAGVYHYKMDDGVNSKNTIWTLGGNYNFSNFGIGATYLKSSLKDSKGDSDGYVLSLNYGDLKTWRSGTYSIFAKNYNQPRTTYIAHDMNGKGSWMQGFKGYGLGINYTFAKNLVGGMEFFDLTDKISGEKGRTWWNELTYYF